MEKTTRTCSTCNDTHLMQRGDQEVMCTFCPVPCRRCSEGGNGPYCTATPCPCDCHKVEATSLSGEENAAWTKVCDALVALGAVKPEDLKVPVGRKPATAGQDLLVRLREWGAAREAIGLAAPCGH